MNDARFTKKISVVANYNSGESAEDLSSDTLKFSQCLLYQSQLSKTLSPLSTRMDGALPRDLTQNFVTRVGNST